jgi:glutamate carboxypeptidase
VFREDIGYGAIYEAARILNAMRDSLAGEPNLTFNPGMIVGGTAITHDSVESRGTAAGKNNVIAERAVVTGDIRTLTPEQLERGKAAMRALVARHLPHTSAEIAFDDGYPPMAPVEGNYRLLALFDQASRDLGFGPVTAVDPARAGAADVAFVAGRVDMAIDGVGLMGDGGHTVTETADLRTMAIQAKRVAVVLWRIVGEQGAGSGER